MHCFTSNISNNHLKQEKMQRYAHHCPDSLMAGVEILEVGYNLKKSQKQMTYFCRKSFCVMVELPLLDKVRT